MKLYSHRIFKDCPAYSLKLPTAEKTLMDEQLWQRCHSEILFVFILDSSQFLSLVTINLDYIRRANSWE